jgi:hypothetical protein
MGWRRIAGVPQPQLGPQLPRLFPFLPPPELPLRRPAPSVFPSRVRNQPRHIRGGEEVQDRLAAPLVGEEVPNLGVIIFLAGFPSHLRPQDFPLGIPLGAILEEVLSGLGLALAPPALGGGPVLRPVKVPSSETVTRLQVGEQHQSCP